MDRGARVDVENKVRKCFCNSVVMMAIFKCLYGGHGGKKGPIENYFKSSSIQLCMLFYFQASWTPIHQAIHSGHADCLHMLLTYKCSHTPAAIEHNTSSDPTENLVDDVINLVDKDGWTVAHLAASRECKVGDFIA